MAYNNYEYPHTDPHRHNDDWALCQIKEMRSLYEYLKKRLDELGTKNSAEVLANLTDSSKMEYNEDIPENIEELASFYNEEKLLSMTTDDFYALWDGIMRENPRYMTKEKVGESIEGVGTIYRYHWEHRVQDMAEDENKDRVTNYENAHQQREGMVIISGQHGNEKQNMIVLALLFRFWARRESKLGTYLLDNFSFDIIPVMNPYGVDHNTRENERGADLNRSWPYGREARHTPDQPESYNVYQYIRSLYFGTQGSKVHRSYIIVDSHDFIYDKDDNRGILTRSASIMPSMRERSLKYSTNLYEKSIALYPEFDYSMTDMRVIRWNGQTIDSANTLTNWAGHAGFTSLLIETPNTLGRAKYDIKSMSLAFMNLAGWITCAAEEAKEKNEFRFIRALSELGFYSNIVEGVEYGVIPESLSEILFKMPDGCRLFTFVNSSNPAYHLMPEAKAGFLEITKGYSTKERSDLSLIRWTALTADEEACWTTTAESSGHVKPWRRAGGGGGAVEDKYIFIGDSYGVSTAERGTDYITRIIQKLGLSSADYFKAAEGGAGFAPSGAGRSFKMLLDSLTIPDKNAITKIVVAGGGNDVLTTEIAGVLETGIREFMEYAKSNFPNATVYCGYLYSKPHGWDIDLWRKHKYALQNYTNISAYGGVYMTGSEYILHNYAEYFTSEATPHPNDRGNLSLANHLINCLKGMPVAVYNLDVPTDENHKVLYNDTRVGDERLISNAAFREYQNGSKVYLEFTAEMDVQLFLHEDRGDTVKLRVNPKLFRPKKSFAKQGHFYNWNGQLGSNAIAGTFYVNPVASNGDMTIDFKVDDRAIDYGGGYVLMPIIFELDAVDC